MAALFLKEKDNNAMWMATGGKSQLKLASIGQLAGRKCVVHPDKDGYEAWKKICDEGRRQGYKIYISDIIKNANLPENADIWDLANL